jgi:flagellar biosynthesis repressor protein FlbT
LQAESSLASGAKVPDRLARGLREDFAEIEMDGLREVRLEPGEMLFVNGAALRVDREVKIEVVGDATIMNEGRIMHASDVTTPLKKLYFAMQIYLIDGGDDPTAKLAMEETFEATANIYRGSELEAAVACVGELMDKGREYQALDELRARFHQEAEILSWSKIVKFVARSSN